MLKKQLPILHINATMPGQVNTTPVISYRRLRHLSLAIETKFLCVSKELELGSFRDRWKVVWCQPD